MAYVRVLCDGRCPFTLGQPRQGKKGRAGGGSNGRRPLPERDSAWDGGADTGRILGVDGPRGFRIRLRRRWKFFVAELFFSTAAIAVSSVPQRALCNCRGTRATVATFATTAAQSVGAAMAASRVPISLAAPAAPPSQASGSRAFSPGRGAARLPVLVPREVSPRRRLRHD